MGRTLVLLLSHVAPVALLVHFREIFPIEYSGTVAAALSLGLIVTHVSNLYFRRSKGARHRVFHWAHRDPGDYQRLVLWAISDRDHLVEITSSNRKVYIGRVLSVRLPGLADEWISLFPLMSGYRHANSLTLEITTYYDAVFREELAAIGRPQEAHDLPRFEVVLRREEIMSIRPFSLEKYASFLEAEDDVDGSSTGKG